MGWSEMQPRLRDAWLAERAGGWENVRVAPTGQLFGEINVPYRYSAEVPYYTTDPAAALALAEAMRAKGYTVTLFLWAGWEPAERRYSAEIANSDYAMANGSADTLPTSISLAAFRALGGEE